MRLLIGGLSLVLMLGCGPVKSRTKVSLPPAYAAAQNATLPELVGLVNDRYAQAKTLRVSGLKVEFTSGSVNTGFVEEYRSAKGILVARQPESIYFNLLNPLTSSTVVTMTAVGPDFQIWVPSRNRFLVGKTDVQVQEKNPIFQVRPQHLLEGILVAEIPKADPRHRYFMYETEDGRFRYYVIGIIEVSQGVQEAQLVRTLWIERSKMDLIRQHYYQSGRMVSEIKYENPLQVNDLVVHSRVSVERKRENYRIALEMSAENLRVNVPIREDAFVLPVPSGAEVVEVVGEDEIERSKALQ